MSFIYKIARDPQVMFRVIILGKQLYGCLLPDELEDFLILIGWFFPIPLFIGQMWQHDICHMTPGHTMPGPWSDFLHDTLIVFFLG